MTFVKEKVLYFTLN